MKHVAVEVPDDVYARAEQRAMRHGSGLVHEVAELIKRYGEGASDAGSAGPSGPADSNGSASPLKERFDELARQWRKANEFVSSTTDIVMHPAYQQIIGMGPDVLPLIFAELHRRPEPWFWALKAITGEDPVAPADRGRIQAMSQAWLAWAARRGY
jgi:hypothetical protein